MLLRAAAGTFGGASQRGYVMYHCLLVALVICQKTDAPEAAKTVQAATEEQIRQWQAILGDVTIDDDLRSALALVPPQAESAFVKLTSEKLSATLVRDSLAW